MLQRYEKSYKLEAVSCKL